VLVFDLKVVSAVECASMTIADMEHWIERLIKRPIKRPL